MSEFTERGVRIPPKGANGARHGVTRSGIRGYLAPRKLISPTGLLLKEFCDEPSPAGLMAGANAGPVVPMKVFIEEDVVAPVRIALESVLGAEDGPSPGVIAQEDAYQAV